MIDNEIPWDDPRLGSGRDTHLTARYRKLQSWWRHAHLQSAPGHAPRRSKPVGSLLQQADVDTDPWLNFIHPAAWQHAEQRAVEVQREGGTLRRDRLFGNLLSSMPLCFNVFGALGDHPDFVWFLRQTFAPDAISVERVLCEWSPRPTAYYLDDRTAFDAAIWHLDAAGRRCLLGIEVKYTDTFSPKPYTSTRYDDVSRRSGWFRPEAEKRLVASPTNQLWRNALLAASVELAGDVDHAVLGVLHLGEDPAEIASIDAFTSDLVEGDRFVSVTLDDLCQAASNHPEFGGWSATFRQRYLDSPGNHTSSNAPVHPPLPPERVWPDDDSWFRDAERLSWEIATALLTFYDVDFVSESHPGDGQYDCLDLHGAGETGSRISLNQRTPRSCFAGVHHEAVRARTARDAGRSCSTDRGLDRGHLIGQSGHRTERHSGHRSECCYSGRVQQAPPPHGHGHREADLRTRSACTQSERENPLVARMNWEGAQRRERARGPFDPDLRVDSERKGYEAKPKRSALAAGSPTPESLAKDWARARQASRKERLKFQRDIALHRGVLRLPKSDLAPCLKNARSVAELERLALAHRKARPKQRRKPRRVGSGAPPSSLELLKQQARRDGLTLQQVSERSRIVPPQAEKAGKPRTKRKPPGNPRP